jgi:hypothetical protein
LQIERVDLYHSYVSRKKKEMNPYNSYGSLEKNGMDPCNGYTILKKKATTIIKNQL